MQPIIRSQQQPSGNGARPAQRVRGRDMADATIRLRVYVAQELRKHGESSGLDQDHWSAAAVTACTISLERQGVRGIGPDVDCNVVQ